MHTVRSHLALAPLLTHEDVSGPAYYWRRFFYSFVFVATSASVSASVSLFVSVMASMSASVPVLVSGSLSVSASVCVCVSGLTQQYLQPETRFSVSYHSLGATPYKALRFFDGSQPNAVCGSPSLVLASGVHLPMDDKGAIIELPESVVEDGATQKLVWGEFVLSSSQKNNIVACICDFEFSTASLSPQGSCSDPEDFSIHAGFLTISGKFSNAVH